MNTLTQKLLIKSDTNWLILHAPPGYLKMLEPLPKGSKIVTKPNGNFNGIQLFVMNKKELASLLKIVVPLLKPETILWICYPKKSSGIESDLKMGSWEIMDHYKLCGVASIAVDEQWAGSRFRPEGQSKLSGTGNEDIRRNEYSKYIDVDRKKIILPEDLKYLLDKSVKALNSFDQLSYSNKKEYVLWILTAKRNETRKDRLKKTIEKLEMGKKNPAEKG